ncbi:MAG: hydroxymethylglutaryl-CoA lyase [Gammaproteobacteria bacterium]|nr:hydroxymethylglutaryl-CoA lyase [Gammaproteobacteria bacterium]
MKRKVTIVEVGMRDGLQSVESFIPTATKLSFLKNLYAAGVRRIEVTSVVSKTAVPQLADAAEIIKVSNSFNNLDAQVLVPKVNHAEVALQAGAKHLAFVVSVSGEHNQSNVRQSPSQSVAEYAKIVSILPQGIKLRLNLATAFDCPFTGPVSVEKTLAILDDLIPLAADSEIALCDTTGRVTPDHVDQLYRAVQQRYPAIDKWAFHGHDTYGLGLANVYSAWKAGVNIFDASFAGLGGCPFAPGTTGNVATEDVLYMFEQMRVCTEIDLDAFMKVSKQARALPGAQTGGRVQLALERACLTS